MNLMDVYRKTEREILIEHRTIHILSRGLEASKADVFRP